jgi:DNA-binding transcriptional regulator YhcF (GntR family)
MGEQKFQLPNNMTENKSITPKDLLVYITIKRFDNPQKKCYPSLRTIAELSEMSVNTVRKCIQNLKDANYIDTKVIDRKTYYYFIKTIEGFEEFTKEFLDNPDISQTTKCYILVGKQHMFNKNGEFANLNYSPMEMSEICNMPYSTVTKCERELKNKEMLTVIPTEATDKYGNKVTMKIFQLAKLGLYLYNKVQQHDNDIEQLKEDNLEKARQDAKRDKMIELLIERIDQLENSSNKSDPIIL